MPKPRINQPGHISYINSYELAILIATKFVELWDKDCEAEKLALENNRERQLPEVSKDA